MLLLPFFFFYVHGANRKAHILTFTDTFHSTGPMQATKMFPSTCFYDHFIFTENTNAGNKTKYHSRVCPNAEVKTLKHL